MAHPDPTPSSFSPAKLVAGIEGGDRLAEAELISRYRRGVNVILRRSLPPQDVEDLAQEVFLRAIEKIRAGQVREPEKLSGYICSLARNLAIGHLRKVQPTEPQADTEDVYEEPSGGPLSQLLRQEDERTVKRVLAELTSPRDRELLLRFYINEESKDSICLDFGISSLHFNRVLFRARERFRELYTFRENEDCPG